MTKEDLEFHESVAEGMRCVGHVLETMSPTTIEIPKKKLVWLEKLELGRGAHKYPGVDACVMEAVAYIAGEPWSDHPACASPLIAAFLRRWNDDLDDASRQMLKPYTLKLIGTASTPEVEDARAWLVCDWLVRQHTPAWLDLAGCKTQASALRALPELTKATCVAATLTIREAKKGADAARAAAWVAARVAAGDAARAAAWDAAWVAAGDAARAAAWVAAGDAARVAAWDAARVAAGDAARAAAGDAARAAAWVAAGDAARAAAWDAARVAAGDAARAAAWDALKPTVMSLQQSALDLVERMIALSPRPEGTKP